MPQGGNIANLNIQVTSNIQQAQTQLNNLQRTLNSIKSGGNILPNLNNAISSLNNFNGISANTVNNMTNIRNSGSLVTNMFLGWMAIGKNTIGSLSTYFKVLASDVNDVGELFKSLWGHIQSLGNSGVINWGILDKLTLFFRGTTQTDEAIANMKNSFSTLFDTIRTILGGMGRMFVTTFAVVGAGAIAYLTVKFTELLAVGVKYNAQMEQMKIGLEVLAMDSNKAFVIMERIKQYADWSTYTTPQVTSAAQLLMNYGIAGQDVLHVIRMLGDTSAGNAEKFRSQALAFGQIFSRGKLTGDNLRQLTEAGINPLQELSQMTGKTVGQLQKEMETGSISVGMLVEAFEKATSEGGRFYNMQQRLSQSGTGLWSTVQDKAMRVLGAATEQLFNKLKPILEGAVNLLTVFLNKAEEIGYAIEDNIVPALNSVIKQLMQIVGLTGDGKEGFDGISVAVDTWTKVMGGALKALMAIVNLGVILGGVLVEGFATAGILSLTVFRGIKMIVWDTGKYIVEVFKWAWGNAYNGLLDLGNKMAESTWWGKAVQKILPTGERKSVASFSSLAGSAWGDSWDGMKTEWGNYWNFTGVMSNAVTGALKNLFGNTSGVDDFISSITGKNKPFIDTQKGITGIAKTLDDASKEANKMGDSILSLVDKLVNMGNVFEKLTYEKFSPYKLMIRMQRFFDEMKSWTGRLATLATQGVPEHMIAGLRDMGVQGYGITKALTNASAEQRAQIVAQYESSRAMGWDIAKQQTRYEQVIVNVTGNSVVSPELVNVLTDEIVRKLRLVGA
jgi:tape measure domain-containing protein